MIRGAIFDLDGTLLDSNPLWDKAPDLYLSTQGKTAEPGLAAKIFAMTLPEAAAFLAERYGLPQSTDEIVDGINTVVADFYLRDAPLKPGVPALLDRLRAGGVPMAVATVTDRPLVEAALRRHGVLDYFTGIVTTAEAGAGKRFPDVYLLAAKLLGTAPAETLVFEDALHALETAKKAGFRCAGVYDAASADRQEEIRSISDIYLAELAEFDQTE